MAAVRRGQPTAKYADDTEAVVLLDEQILNIKENGETRTIFRRAYKILRTTGRDRGVVNVYYRTTQDQLVSFKGWSLPPDGKESEAKEKDAVEHGLSESGEYSDERVKRLRIPGSEPGNVIGYEYELVQHPDILQSVFYVQDLDPIREAKFSIQIPAGWEYKTHWANHAEVAPQQDSVNHWTWDTRDNPALPVEPEMPSARALEGRLVVNYFPTDATVRQKTFSSWDSFGRWFGQLSAGRRSTSNEIHQKVQELTASAPAPLDKMRALATFVQRQIRYVAVEIGVGGYQPRAAAETFLNRYGDCKDKATLLSTMLKEAGIESYYVIIQTRRGLVAADSPPENRFNHAILAIRVPDGVPASELYAVYTHPRLESCCFLTLPMI